MSANLPTVATVPFLGRRVEVKSRKQFSSLSYDGKYFYASPKLASNFDAVVSEYEKFCQKKLSDLIKSQINTLRRKKVRFKKDYTDGTKNFKKELYESVDSYLTLIGYSKNIDFEIGKYEKEWGINQITPKKKKFTLFFNLNLIKYDSGQHIKYVVAHELSHVFFRDHGSDFEQTLQRLYSQKNQSEKFWNGGFVSNFSSPASSNLIIWIILGTFVVAIIYLLLNFILSLDISKLFDFGSQNNQGKF